MFGSGDASVTSVLSGLTAMAPPQCPEQPRLRYQSTRLMREYRQENATKNAVSYLRPPVRANLRAACKVVERQRRHVVQVEAVTDVRRRTCDGQITEEPTLLASAEMWCL